VKWSRDTDQTVDRFAALLCLWTALASQDSRSLYITDQQ